MELLVLAAGRTHADPEKDRRGCHKKGDIIVVKPDGHEWGAHEALPDFVIVRCAGVDHQQYVARTEPWRWDLSFTVVSSVLSQDRHRIRAENTTRSPSGGASLTLARVQAFLERWGASVVSSTATSVTFDVRIYDAAISEGFLGRPLGVVNGITFTEELYTQATGLHRIVADYRAHPLYATEPDRVRDELASLIRGAGATVIPAQQGFAVYEVTRNGVREAFRAEVTGRLGTWRRHRYAFTAADVDIAIAQGGAIDVSPAQIASRIVDRQAE